jgi:hypothetical protein
MSREAIGALKSSESEEIKKSLNKGLVGSFPRPLTKYRDEFKKKELVETSDSNFFIALKNILKLS